MIGEVLFSVALEAILREVISLANEEIRLVWGFKEELRKLRNTLTVILAVLEDAEKQQEKYVPVRIWLARVKDVAYDAEDVLDEFAYEKLRGKMEIGNRMKNKVRNFFSPSNPLAFQFKMVHLNIA
ncbi:hypothetical protein HHK36_020012 [Tetracentron sinense]|uniref:Disease resistance N-terminal domain-containing protein n=1 Tax=Tetracentron sinense TaxID=13715 RepID=A0A835DB86_TETSI|nr:hypothetical protein HHK36_020012 [Tetracentron sinense]